MFLCVKSRVSILETPKMKIVECANSLGPDEAAHNEPPHLDLNCLSSSL